MTKSRKIAISVALALLFVMTCATVVPLYSVGNANVAYAVTVQTREEWTNSYSGTYYDNLNTDLTGSAFRSALAKLIEHTNNPTYDNLKTIFKTTDADPTQSGNVIWFYTGNSIPYTGAMDSGNYRTNREHVWPKMNGAAFPATSQAGSDAHHLRPLNTQLNNTRSNYHFGEVAKTTANRVLQDGPLANYGTDDPDTWCYLSGGYFYPAKGYRGATARILFYVQTRWGDTSSLSFTLGSGGTKVMSNVDILLKWHLEEPPTDEEIRRNDAVYSIQGNRNPFIDHPEYVEMIYCYDGQSYNNTLQQVVATYGSYLDNSNTGTGGGETETPDPTPTPDPDPTPTPDPDPTPTPDPDTGDYLQAFTDSMSALESATTLEGRYKAIKDAINAYNQLTQTEKDANAADYQKLATALSQYNEEVADINGEFHSANNLAAQIMVAGISASFMALVALVGKFLLGGK